MLRKLFFLLMLFGAATAVVEVVEFFSPMAEAFRAYREVASAQAQSSRNDARFREIEGYIAEVTYALESGEKEGDDGVRLVVLEAIHFQKGMGGAVMGERTVAKTRQRVLMRQTRNGWEISELEEDATEITRAKDIEFE